MKKILILLVLVAFSNEIKAEHFFDFYLQDLDFSSYPLVKVKGAVINYATEDMFFEGKAFAENIVFFESDREIKIDISFTYINKNIQIFTITYNTELPEEDVREFLLQYDRNGFHNGSEGQNFSYNPSEHKYIKELVNEDSDEALGLYLNNLIIDYDRDGLQEMYVLARNGLLIREAPTTNSKVIGKLDFGQRSRVSLEQYGEEVSVVENEKMHLAIDGKFRKTTYEGKEGYVFDGYLTSFSFFKSVNKNNPCYSIYDIPESERSNQKSRISSDQDKYGEFILFSYISLQEVYLLAQGFFGDFKQINITEEQDYGEIFNGWEHYTFKNSNFTFKILKFEGNNDFSYYRLYFGCFG